jgi:glyoxylase-like metal-dependent hydrolase (beta-lactamase superfamily II)
VLIAGFPAGSFATNCYVVAPAPGEECIIIDPGQDAEPGVTQLLAEYRLRPVAVLATHGHVDHIWSVAPVCGAQGIPAYIHPADRALLSDPAKGFPLQVGQQLFRGLTFTEPDDVIALADGMTLRLAGVELVVDHAPGHTPGSVTFRTGNQGESGEPSRRDGGAHGSVTKERGDEAAGGSGGSSPRASGAHGSVTEERGDEAAGGSGGSSPRASGAHGPVTEERGDEAAGGSEGSSPRASTVLFSGDLLFAGSIGRTDLPGGDYPTILDSLSRVCLVLTDDTRVLPGHGPQTTIGAERATNPFLAGLAPAPGPSPRSGPAPAAGPKGPGL